MYPAHLLIRGQLCLLDSHPDTETKDLDGEEMSERASPQNYPAGEIMTCWQKNSGPFLSAPTPHDERSMHLNPGSNPHQL